MGGARDGARRRQEQDENGGDGDPQPGPRRGAYKIIPKGRTLLAERVFADLFRDWQLLTLGCLHVAVPRGTPVYAAESLSRVVGGISAARAMCLNGTGWPARSGR